MFPTWPELLLRLEQLPLHAGVALALLLAAVLVGCVLLPVVLLVASESNALRRCLSRQRPAAPRHAQPWVRVVCWLEAINTGVGRCVAWLALFMVLVQFVVVIMRYVFSIGSIQMQESIWYMHGMLFMLGAGYTLLKDGHVRIDVFYREANEKRRALIDLLGTLVFLFPFLAFVWWCAWSYVLNAWAVRESSLEISGLPYIYLLKTVLLLFVVLMAVQGIARVIRSALTVLGLSPPRTGDAL